MQKGAFLITIPFSTEVKFSTDDILKYFLIFPRKQVLTFNAKLRYVRLYDTDIPKEKWLNYLQTAERLNGCHILWRLVRVSTVCQLPI